MFRRIVYPDKFADKPFFSSEKKKKTTKTAEEEPPLEIASQDQRIASMELEIEKMEAELLGEAGLPDGLFQIVHGDHKVGRAICAHPGIAKISLTGGGDTGRLIMGQSAETLKKVTLELGGKSPMLVFADADFDLLDPAGPKSVDSGVSLGIR